MLGFQAGGREIFQRTMLFLKRVLLFKTVSNGFAMGRDLHPSPDSYSQTDPIAAILSADRGVS